MKNQIFTHIKRIYTADYTSVGHTDGVIDGKQGKPKVHWGVFTKRHWANFVWQANTAHDTYVDGYNKGYDGGLRIRENIYHEQSNQSNSLTKATTGTPMSNLQRYDRVLAGLQTAKVNIQQNINQLQSQLDLYSRQIQAMQNVGFLEDYTEKLKAYNGLEIRINGLKGFLQQIMLKISDIETHIQQLKQDANRP